MSKYQDLIETKLRNLFKTPDFHFEINERPNWLKSPVTDQKLELDISIYRLHYVRKHDKIIKSKFPILAFEIQGEQHFKYVKQFGSHNPDHNKFIDVFKHEVCAKRGIPLIEIFYSEINVNTNILQIILDRRSGLNRYCLRKLEMTLEAIGFSLEKNLNNVNAWLYWHEKRVFKNDLRAAHIKRYKKKKKSKFRKLEEQKLEENRKEFINNLDAWVDFLKN